MVNANLLLSTCRRCGKKQLSANMRLSPDGKGMICKECLAKEPGTVRTGSRKVFTPEEPAQRKPASKEPMARYRCQSCNYSFERKKSAKIEKCPYCGKGALVPDSKLSSDSLIEESEDPRYASYSKDF